MRTSTRPICTAPRRRLYRAGQIELYSHVNAFRTLVDFLKSDGWTVCAVYCLDCHFITEAPKYIAGAMQVTSMR